MINQRHCPFCKAPAADECEHLALAAEGREFVRRCVEACHGQRQWESLCRLRREWHRNTGEWSPEQDDIVWLETAFSNEFLRPLRWFGGMEHEWRTGPKLSEGGFWVLLWSREPRRLWWELRDEFDRQALKYLVPPRVPAQHSARPLFP